MANAAVMLQPEEPSRLAAAVLSAGMHFLLLLVLVVGVSWQSRAPEAISVELWQPAPEPVVEPPPETKPVPKPEPPPPPKQEVAPPPPPPKPDIAVEKEKKVPKKEEPKKQRPLNLDMSREIKEQAERELAQVQRAPKRDVLADFKPAPAASATVRTDARYADAVRGKIKPLITLPPDIRGNPESVFDVEQLPTGDVINVRLRVSSGNVAYDDAVDRAIRKASPLPKPPPPQVAPRMLELRFRPKD